MPPDVLPIYKHFDPKLTVFDGSLANWSDYTNDQIGLRDPLGKYPMGERSFTLDSFGIQYYEQLGYAKAKGIVAYRELRELREITDDFSAPTWSTGSYNVLDDPSGMLRPSVLLQRRLRSHDWDTNGDDSPGITFGDDFLAGTNQRHTAGFLTVGELANVSNRDAFDDVDMIPDGAYQMDNGQTQTRAPVPPRRAELPHRRRAAGCIGGLGDGQRAHFHGLRRSQRTWRSECRQE